MAFFPFPKAVSMFLGHTIIVWYKMETGSFQSNLKSASNLNGNLNCSKELEHYAS